MNIVTPIVDLFYPRVCMRCSRKLTIAEKYLCAHCMSEMPQTDSHLLKNNPVSNELASLVKINEAYAWFYYNRKGSYGKLITDIKYRRNFQLARYLGYLYAKELKDAGKLKNIEYVHPVPLHAARLKKRGYNQSEKIAEGVAAALGVKTRTDILARVEPTTSQVRKNRYERWKNMQDVFEAAHPPTGEEETGILLVDDVITTGSTILACAEALEKAGYKNVSVIGLAYSSAL